MEIQEIITLALAVVIPMGGMFAWLCSRLDKKFDKIDTRFEHMDTRFDEVRKDIQTLTSRVDRLEVRVEERTFRVVYPHEEKKVQ